MIHDSIILYDNKYFDTKSDVWIECPRNSRYFLPLLNLLRRLCKGPFKVYTARLGNYSSGPIIELEVKNEAGNGRITQRFNADDLYLVGRNQYAQVVYRAIRRQQDGMRQLAQVFRDSQQVKRRTARPWK